MSRDPQQPSGVGGLVAALRQGKTGGAPVRRSPDLEALLPPEDPARVVWDLVAGQDAERLRVAFGKLPEGAPPAEVLFALWLHALCVKVASAAELAQRCQSDLGFRWLSGGAAIDVQVLLVCRQPAVDDLLADNLAGLLASGAVGAAAPAAARTDEERLRNCLDEARRRVSEQRQHLADPASPRAVRADERSPRAAAALAELTRIAEFRQAQAKREQAAREAQVRAAERAEEEKRRAAQAAATPAVPVPAIPAPVAPAPAAVPRERSRSGYAITVRPVFGYEPDLPWSRHEEDSKLRRFGLVAASVFVATSAVLLFYKPPVRDRSETEKISPRLAKLVLERKELPKPEPVKVEEKPKEKKPDEPKPEEAKPVEAPKVEARKEIREQPKKPLEPQVAEARERASKTGLVAMRDQLAALRELGNTDALRQEQTRVGAAGTERPVERDLIGKAATSGSGGVTTRSVAHAGGGTLEGRSTSRVSGPAGGGGAPSLAEIEKESKGTKRTAEEIKLAFDANKSAIYGIYRRALRANPLLEGRVVLKLTIDPAGQVTTCSIVSSALKDPELEEKLLARIQLINFGTRPKLEPWTGTYHIDFVPSS